MLRRKGIKGVFESIPYLGADYETGLIKLDKNTNQVGPYYVEANGTKTSLYDLNMNIISQL